MGFGDDQVEIRVDAKAFRGWTAVQVSASLEEACRTFSFATGGSYEERDDALIAAGAACSIWVGGERVATGYADEVDDQLDAATKSLTYRARSKTCDLVDCSAPLGSWRNIRLDRLVTELLAGFDVEAHFALAEAAALIIPRHRTAVGETVFAALDRLCSERGVLLTDDAAGRLVFDRVAATGTVSTTRIEVGRNVLAASGKWSLVERFSSYTVAGQVFLDLEVDPAATAGATDPGVTRYRPLIVDADRGTDRAGALAKARWEAVTRAGKSFGRTYTLAGWRQDDGTLWAPGQRVLVTDRRAGLSGAELLIVGVDLGLDDGGRKTSLRCAPAAGYQAFVAGKSLVAPGSGAGGLFFDGRQTIESTRPDYSKLRPGVVDG